MKRLKFTGLKIEDYIFEDEAKMKEGGFLENKWVKELLNKAGDASVAFLDTVKNGTYIRINQNVCPELFKIYNEVCDILDCHVYSEMYAAHNDTPYLLPCGTQKAYLVLTSRLLEEYDEDMLYYAFGNAVAMIKSGHVEITYLSNYLPGKALYTIPKVPLLNYLHAADVTSDRGGLLACQSFAAAARCHFLELGLPVSESRKLFKTDEEASHFVRDYLKSVKKNNNLYEGLIYKAGKLVQETTYVEAPANRMLSEMYDWYTDKGGYCNILGKFGG